MIIFKNLIFPTCQYFLTFHSSLHSFIINYYQETLGIFTFFHSCRVLFKHSQNLSLVSFQGLAIKKAM